MIPLQGRCYAFAKKATKEMPLARFLPEASAWEERRLLP